MENNMQEFRCRCCNRMLARILECRVIEIKCPKCKTINLYKDSEIILVQLGPNYTSRLKPQDPVAN